MPVLTMKGGNAFALCIKAAQVAGWKNIISTIKEIRSAAQDLGFAETRNREQVRTHALLVGQHLRIIVERFAGFQHAIAHVFRDEGIVAIPLGGRGTEENAAALVTEP